MPRQETITESLLSIDEQETDAEVRLTWRGKSNDREPGRFLMPLLNRLLDRGADGQKQLVLDFSALDYMNSSTFTPLVKTLDAAARGKHRVLIEFAKARKWQTLSFSALRAFETSDGRIELRGK